MDGIEGLLLTRGNREENEGLRMEHQRKRRE